MRLKRSTVLAIVILLCSLLLWAAQVRCQQDVHPKHETQEDFEDTIALKKVEIMSFDERLVYWKRNLKMRVELGSFAYDKYSKFPDGKPPKGGCHWAVYCKEHNFVYFFVPCKE